MKGIKNIKKNKFLKIKCKAINWIPHKILLLMKLRILLKYYLQKSNIMKTWSPNLKKITKKNIMRKKKKVKSQQIIIRITKLVKIKIKIMKITSGSAKNVTS